MGASFVAYNAASGPVTPFVFQDNFNRGAGVSTGLGTNWDSTAIIAQDNYAMGSTDGSAYVSAGAHTFGSNQYVQFQPYSWGNGKSYHLYLRGGLCHMVWPTLTGSNLSMRVYDANVFDTTIVPLIYDVVRFEAFGAILRIKLNGTTVWTGTSTNTSGSIVGQPGFGMSTNQLADNFECGDLLA
ncbi:hypothetical protein UFOVP1008_39 [uncultured Caudovirales phage]|uniref:Uncharacterized protein n=1 Tax=uncultured Caudovirales phage TaxID=2100421 RepID=A0A6J5MHY5_9CAUD|nr:hypothetical protein UFOVP498_47 [uncultured Caudovirales phage]CAB4177727.1 hypothetical protein UFOVP1008_39 [uncultured Caudovirales phage]CAB4187152.1 hypothetical protein UFOVP1160_7 [uncultured Caudovirales phage]CAB4200323.1 hypothetical protein UFOVP1352_43 [uncultured Caudovirales phage]